MKRKVIIGISICIIGILNFTNYDVKKSINKDGYFYENLVQEASAQSELTAEQKAALLSLESGTYTVNSDGTITKSSSYVAAGKQWDTDDHWYNWDGGNFKPYRQICSGTVTSTTNSYNGSYNPSASYAGVSAGFVASGGYTQTTTYGGAGYAEERVVCTTGSGNCINGEGCTRV